jgi:succinoglycan biosynthesis transport protein ExoP
MIAAVTLAGSVVGFGVTRVIKPQYRAQATIWIDARDQREGGPAPFRPGRLFDPEAWLDLVRSYAVLDDVARRERLYLRLPKDAAPALWSGFAVADSFRAGVYRLVAGTDGGGYRLETAEGTELDRVAAGAAIGASLGFRWSPPAGVLAPGSDAVFEVVTLRDASDALAQQLTLHIDPEGNLLRMELEGTDRDRLVRLLDGVAQRYVAVSADLKRQKLTELTGILADQLATATRDLVAAEAAYQDFRTRTITLPSARVPAAGAVAAPDPAVDRYLALAADRDALEHDREAIDRALAGSGGVAIEALTSVPAAQTSRELGPALDELATTETELRGLRARYSDEHPTVRQLIDRVSTLRTVTIPTLARSLSQELRTREGQARQEVGGAAAGLRSIPARSVQEARLLRTMTLAEDLHNTLQQRYEEARLAVASSIPDTRVLDPAAAPRYPVRDTATRLMAMSFLGSLAAALALAVLLDRLDPRFRYASQVSRDLGLTILGALPHLPRASKGDQAHPAAVGPLIESLRGVRLSLLTAAEGDPPLTLAISSPGSGDGKSFLSSHLAFAFAEAGYRTVLVDGDIRCGRLHQRFGTERRPGLSDVLQGTVPLREALRVTGFAGLQVLPCGARMQLAPELLASAAMSSLMDELRGRFDVIICDTPPLSAGIDPFVLATATGRLLLVVRNGVSDRETLTGKLGVLDRMPVQLLGVVMNDVPMDRTYGYYSYHLAGYEARDESGPTAVVQVLH